MPAADLLAMIRKRPFVPFRLHISDGTVYEIQHPEMVMPGVSSAVIGLPATPADPLYSSTEIVALRHIVRLVPVESSISG